MTEQTPPSLDNLTPQQMAIEALREVAQNHLITADGFFPGFSTLDYSGAAVLAALTEAGEVETVNRHESYSGLQQPVWQGKRLREHSRPSAFRGMRLPRYDLRRGY
ncbi:MAG TPA: hypothetical protein VM619_14575 [Luteimonas sp.]|nr:hypothetical protein [Luteimonas sp.]